MTSALTDGAGKAYRGADRQDAGAWHDDVLDRAAIVCNAHAEVRDMMGEGSNTYDRDKAWSSADQLSC